MASLGSAALVVPSLEGSLAGVGQWGYAVAWFLVNDRTKLLAYRIFDLQKGALRGPAGTHGTYCAIALLTWSGLPLESLISLAQTFSISSTTFFGIGT
jgi:hypothetical protein